MNDDFCILILSASVAIFCGKNNIWNLTSSSNINIFKQAEKLKSREMKDEGCKWS